MLVSQAAFEVLIWTTFAAVGAVFCYLVYALVHAGGIALDDEPGV